MPSSSILLAILLSVGAVQGLVCALILLIKKKDNGTAAYLMAALLLCFAYRLINEVLLLFGIGKYDTWYHFTQEFNWAYGPLIYLFVRAWLDASFRMVGRDWLVFLPVLLEFTLNNFVRTQNFYWDGTRESLSWAGYWGYVVWMNYPFKYIVASILLVVFCRRAEVLVSRYAAAEKVAWLARVLRLFRWYFALIVGIVLLDFALFFDASFRTFYWYFTRFYYYPLFIGIAAITYWLGMEVALRGELPKPVRERPEEADKLAALAERIRREMEREKAFTNPQLTVQLLADRLDEKAYLVSRCLREVMATRFTDYVNQLRVAELKRLLRQPGKAHYTLLSMAYDAGFNSKASFHRAVKKYEGVSPGELRDQLR